MPNKPSLDNLRKHSKKRMDWVDQSIHELSIQSQEVQKSVWGAFLENVLMDMQIKAKKIESTDHNHEILNNLGTILDKDVRSSDGKKFLKWYVEALNGIGDLNEGYFRESESEVSSQNQNQNRDMTKISEMVAGNHGELLKLLGYDQETGRIVNKSYLYNLLDLNGVYSNLQKKIIDAIFTGQPFDLKGTKEYILGSQQSYISNQTGFGIAPRSEPAKAGNQSGGAVEGAIAAKSFDGFQQYDRALQKSVANDLGYNYAIYQGGLIKSSREFCIERNDKVFSKDEIALFGTPDDKYGGYIDDQGDFDGKREPYNPFVDLGGFNCRHHLDWISDELAVELKKDIVQQPEKTLNIVEDEIRNQDFESAAIFKDGKMIWFKNGEKSEVSFTEEESKLIKDNIFTHNHPSSSSFSAADVVVFASHGAKELRAISKLYDYSISNPKNVKLDYKELYREYRNIQEDLKYEKYDDIVDSGADMKQVMRDLSHDIMEKLSKMFNLKYERTKRHNP